MKRIGYLIPEFPGQTHVWMWREITHLRGWGVPITLFSTRRPGARDAARHAFAPEAAAETSYLWPPRGPVELIGPLLWLVLRQPARLFQAIALCLRLPLPSAAYRLRLLALLFPAARLARSLHQRGIEHLHCHTCGDGALLAMLVRRMVGVPYSLTLNADIDWWNGAMSEKLGDAEFTVAISRRLLEQIGRDFPDLRPDQALLGRIGVDTERWRPAATPRKAGREVVSVGRLHPSKGHDVLLAAVAQLAEGKLDVRLRLIGAGPARQALEAIVAGSEWLRPRVRFLGSLSEDEIIGELHTADVFVLASHAEPLGVVYMEAMALEVATIGTRAGGVEEIISDGRDGILVPPGDVAALAGAIRSLLCQPALRCAIAQAGRRSIVERFDSRLGAATLYERLFQRPPP